MYTKEFILDEVNAIREEIGHDRVEIFIEEKSMEKKQEVKFQKLDKKYVE